MFLFNKILITALVFLFGLHPALFAGEAHLQARQNNLNHYFLMHFGAASDSLSDPWLGSDKGLHLAGSLMCTVAVSQSMQRFGHTTKERARIIGASFSLGLGLGKEVHDGCRTDNFFSYKDLLADCLGIALGWGLLTIP